MASLDELKKRIYAEKESFSERNVSPSLNTASPAKKISWEETAPRNSKSAWVWWVSGAVFVGIVILGWFFLFGPPGFFQVKDVSVNIIGDKEIKSGDRVTWEVKAVNNSKKDLEDATLIFNFPSGSTPINGSLPSGVFRVRKSLGTLRVGESAMESFNAYVFGGKDSLKDVSAVLEYRPIGSSATFASDASFSFAIARSPLSVSFKIPNELRIGQDVELEVDYNSQSEEIIRNLTLQVFFPAGFEYKTASRQPVSSKDTIWKIGDLKPSQSGTIKISGVISGAEAETKVFKAVLGLFDEQKKEMLAYGDISQTVTMRAPFLEVALSPVPDVEHLVFPGSGVNFEVLWKNNLDRDVADASLEVYFDGGAVDLSSLRAEKGSYSELTKKVVWNAATYPAFRSVSAGASGKFDFSFKLKAVIIPDSQKPVVKLRAVFAPGKQVPGFEGVNVSGSTAYEMNIGTKLQFASRVIYNDSVISNSGPLPPKVGNETTYTVVWSLTNMVNDLNGVVVKASLPPYVSFKNIMSPADADVSFDASSGEIVWRVGRLLAGTGFSRSALQMAFQIGFVPSQSQINTSPILINDAEASGKDTFSEKIVTSKDESVGIALPDEPGLSFDKKIVVP